MYWCIVEVVFVLGKFVLCEKFLGVLMEDSVVMIVVVEVLGVLNMVGFNYICIFVS